MTRHHAVGQQEASPKQLQRVQQPKSDLTGQQLATGYQSDLSKRQHETSMSQPEYSACQSKANMDHAKYSIHQDGVHTDNVEHSIHHLNVTIDQDDRITQHAKATIDHTEHSIHQNKATSPHAECNIDQERYTRDHARCNVHHEKDTTYQTKPSRREENDTIDQIECNLQQEGSTTDHTECNTHQEKDTTVPAEVTTNQSRITDYHPGSAAWVKLERWPWWPAKVIRQEESIVQPEPQRAVVACIHFLVENKYDIIYDPSKLRPWDDVSNKELLRRTLNYLKPRPQSLSLFHQVLSELETQCGVTVPPVRTPLPVKRLRHRQSSLTVADSAGTDRSCTMSPCKPADAATALMVNGREGKGFVPAHKCRPHTDMTSEACRRLSDDSKGLTRGTRQRRSTDEGQNVQTLTERRRKRSLSSSSDTQVAMKPKTQRCLEHAFQTSPPSMKTLTWDQNIAEDSCDETQLVPLPLSQPEAATEPDSLTDDDSDDDDLPDVLSSATKDPVTRGTILWVKYYKFPYWPAVVRNCYRRKKVVQKITVQFIGDTIYIQGAKHRPITLRYNRNKMMMFTADHGKNLQFKEDGLNSQCAEAFKEAYSKVEDFLVKKCLQMADCPFSFFFGEIQQDKWDSESAPVEYEFDQTSLSSYSNDGNNNDDKKEPSEEEESAEENLAQELVSDNEEMSERVQSVKSRRKERGERLLLIIRTDRFKKFLKEIYLGQRWSRRHTEYNKDAPRRSLASLSNSGFGPIDDEDQQMELVEFLASHLKTVSDCELPDLAYIFHVWLPEAMIEATHKIMKKTRAVAEEFYLKGPRRLKEEKQQEHRSLMESAKNISPEDAQRYREKLDDFKRRMMLDAQSGLSVCAATTSTATRDMDTEMVV